MLYGKMKEYTKKNLKNKNVKKFKTKSKEVINKDGSDGDSEDIRR